MRTRLQPKVAEGGAARVAWMAMMGANSIDYHRATVIERGDDHPGRALRYYGSRGETPLVWGGSGAPRLGLSGTVTDAQYSAIFAVGGAQDPTTGTGLVETRRPGMELVVSAHKSVAELGVVGHEGIMHGILDAERDATMGYLDGIVSERGGRRGRQRTAAATGGLIYAHTRHATSRAGDPCPHDHVLVANLVEMADSAGGWKAADTALWRDELHAATMVGRLAAARKAVEAGLAIEADRGPSGQLRHWRIAGIPEQVLEVHSKRGAEIDAHLNGSGFTSARARGIAARETRKHKRFEPVGQLMGRWRAELAEVGWPVSRLRASIERSAGAARLLGPLSAGELGGLVRTVLDGDGELARRKVFGRAQVIVAVAPHLFGRPTGDLDRAVAAVLADAEVIPLVGVAGARDRQYTLARTVATELAIASLVAEGAATRGAGHVGEPAVAAAVARVEARLGCPLTVGQREAVSGICGGGRQVSLVLGVAGSGKTTCLSAVVDAYQTAGYRVVGTATSGQAARTLAREAEMDEARTVASLLWRIDHGRLRLDPRTVLILDEAGMTDDPDLLKVLAGANAEGAKVVLVGDDRQLGPVGPGGALGALLRRHHGTVHALGDNVRQTDPAERQALAELRAGDIDRAVAWYHQAGRIRPAPNQDRAVAAIVEAWAGDVVVGADSVILAWRRASVDRLNRQARAAWAAMGNLSGPELQAPGGRHYAAGDRIVALAPTGDPTVLTSQRGRVVHVEQQTSSMMVHLDDGRDVRLAGEQLAADRLAHSYALTVHRAQGLTAETCHHLADGGGRELAYVAMSRARTSTTVHVVADDVDQAAEDLSRDWARDTRARWAIDTGTPGRHHPAGTLLFSPEAAHQLAMQARQARLRAERDALHAAIPADVTRQLVAAECQHRKTSEQLDELRQGHYQGTDRRLVEAARVLHEAVSQRAMAESVVSYGNLGWRRGRAWKRDLARFSQAERLAQTAWQQAAAPQVKQLSETIEQLERTRAELLAAAQHRSDWLAQHPEAYERLHHIERLLNADEHHTPSPEGPDLSPDRTVASRRIPSPSPKHVIPQHPYPAVAQQRPHLDRGIDIGL